MHADAEPIPLPPTALNITIPLIYHQLEKALALTPTDNLYNTCCRVSSKASILALTDTIPAKI